MKDDFGKLKSFLPQLKSVFYRQDNASCYHCGATIVGASFANRCHGVSVKRLDFSYPQGGKGPCDRKAASLKSHMRVHLNQGFNIETSKEMVDLMQSSGGVPGVDATLCRSLRNQKPSLNVKIPGVSLISNMEYNDGSLTVRKAYGIGPGKRIRLSELTTPQVVQVPDLVKCDGDTSEGMLNAHFIKVKSRPQPRTGVDSQRCSDTEEGPVGDTSTVPLFSCPEEGCVKTYQRFSSLQYHLDRGKHDRALENETLLDRAVLGYADRLQEQFCGIPQIQVRKRLNLTSQPCFPMGWALKSSHVRRPRLTKKQKDYLTSKFRIGETTDQKADAASLAKSMTTARDSNGRNDGG